MAKAQLGRDEDARAPMEPDPGREARTGVPEIILAEGKDLTSLRQWIT